MRRQTFFVSPRLLFRNNVSTMLIVIIATNLGSGTCALLSGSGTETEAESEGIVPGFGNCPGWACKALAWGLDAGGGAVSNRDVDKLAGCRKMTVDVNIADWDAAIVRSNIGLPMIGFERTPGPTSYV